LKYFRFYFERIKPTDPDWAVRKLGRFFIKEAFQSAAEDLPELWYDRNCGWITSWD